MFPYRSTQPALPPSYNLLDDIPDLIPPTICTNPVVQPIPEPTTQPTSPHPTNYPHNSTTNLNTPSQAHYPTTLFDSNSNEQITSPTQSNPIQTQSPQNNSSPFMDHSQAPAHTSLVAAQNTTIIPDSPQNPNSVSVHPMVTRFRVGTNRLTKRLNLHVSSVSPLPKSYRDAFSDSNWQNAMRDEYNALIKNKTWILVPRPPDTNIVPLLAASRRWPIHQLDVNNAFLHGDLSETVYMHQPPGFRDSVLSDYQIISSLHQEFAMSDLGPLNYFLGIFVTCDSSGMFLSQKKYVVEILERAHMVNCNPSRTPVDTESKLGVMVIRFLTRLYLVACSDADWAGCPTTRRSTSGYCVFLGNNLLSWSSKRQPTLSCSSAEAEYCGVANAVAETCWLRNLLRELHTPLSFAALVCCDNVSAVYLSCNPVQHQHTKHIEIDLHFCSGDMVVASQVSRTIIMPSTLSKFCRICSQGVAVKRYLMNFARDEGVCSPSRFNCGECLAIEVIILSHLSSLPQESLSIIKLDQTGIICSENIEMGEGGCGGVVGFKGVILPEASVLCRSLMEWDWCSRY
ncbi:ribonuclease H-like domain-containing protein [Tanacetum coccineum]